MRRTEITPNILQRFYLRSKSNSKQIFIFQVQAQALEEERERERERDERVTQKLRQTFGFLIFLAYGSNLLWEDFYGIFRRSLTTTNFFKSPPLSVFRARKNMSAMTGLSSRRIKLSFAAFQRKWNISLSWFGLWGMFGRKRFAKKCCKNSKVESGPYEPGAKKSQNEWFNSVEPKQSGKSLNKRVKPSEVTGSRSEEKTIIRVFLRHKWG